MPSNNSFPQRPALLACAVALAAGLCACAGYNSAAASRSTVPAAPVQPQVVLVAAPAPLPPPDVVAPVLAYADQVRSMQGAELAQEFARLNDSAAPADQLRLALALVQTRQLYDLVRAQDLLQRVLANPGAAARPLHPLARLLLARFAEQRRVEDQLDRQGQQLREVQRRFDQTNEKLEALKEIERSLTSRPGASAPAAASSRGRSRPATP